MKIGILRKKVKAKTFVRKDKNKIITDVSGMQKYLMDRNYYFCQNNHSVKGIRSIDSNVIKNVEEILNKGKLKAYFIQLNNFFKIFYQVNYLIFFSLFV